MIDVRPFASLGGFRNEWLNARHHFSFGQYRDPDRAGVGRLLVWNDDEIAPGTGFDPHPHRDMEIVTYVREGAITHRDSLGNEGRTEAGDVQVMHAGTGITHAEYNQEAGPTVTEARAVAERTAGMTWEYSHLSRWDFHKSALSRAPSSRLAERIAKELGPSPSSF